MAYKDVATNVVSQALKQTNSDANFRQRLLANPALELRNAGLLLPESQFNEFNNYFFNLVSIPQELGLEITSLENSIGCTICKVGAWTLAVAIVSVGVAGLALLTPESAIVIAVAEFLGISAEAALAFITGLANAISSGVSAVAEAICTYLGSCP